MVNETLTENERLTRIKSDAAEFDYPDEILSKSDLLFLLAEIERLTRERNEALIRLEAARHWSATGLKCEADLLEDNERLRAAQTTAVHAAITRALDEAGIRPEVLRGMCIEVGLEAYRASFSASGLRTDE
jgi:hypothetical protein